MDALNATAGPSLVSKENGNIKHCKNRAIPTSAALRRRLTHIPTKQPVLLRLPSGKIKSVELHPAKVVSLGKFGAFRAEDIIGMPFGLTYEIVNNVNSDEKGRGKAAKRGGGGADQQPGDLKVVINRSLTELEETSATNELINDDQGAQALTFLDIRALKELGIQGKEIIQKEVESNTSFQQRSSWSQQKFVMRKESKHLQMFTPIPPTLTNVCDFFVEKFDRDVDKLRGLRADSIANILSLAGVGPGGRYLLVDGVGGALAGAILERMGGEGRLLALNDADSPPAFDLMAQMSLPITAIQPVLKTLHWASTEKSWVPVLQIEESDEVTPTGKVANDRDKQRHRKKKAQFQEFENTRLDFFDGEFDALIIACQYDCVSIIDRLLPYLAGSSHIVVHHPFLQTLTEAHAQLRPYHSLIDVSITEPFQRKYQVLPGRMHPEMNTSATGGYILHAIRVLTDEETRIAIDQAKSEANNNEEEPEKKRRRVEEVEASIGN